MRGTDVDYLNSQLTELEKCRVRLDKYAHTLNELRGAAIRQEATQWWQRGEVVIGGVVVSITVGGIIGYLIAK